MRHTWAGGRATRTRAPPKEKGAGQEVPPAQPRGRRGAGGSERLEQTGTGVPPVGPVLLEPDTRRRRPGCEGLSGRLACPTKPSGAGGVSTSSLSEQGSDSMACGNDSDRPTIIGAFVGQAQ